MVSLINKFHWLAVSFAMLLGSMPLRAEQIPMQAWIHDPVIASVEISPNGKQLAALTLTDVNKAAEITVWETAKLADAPLRFSPPDIKPLFVAWLNDDYLLVYGRQKYDFRLSTGVTKWFRDKLYIVDSKGKRFKEILANQEKISANLESVLPLDKDNVLVSVTNLEFATDYYKLNLKNFSTKRVYRGSPKKNAITNSWGEVVGHLEFKGNSPGARFEFWYKNPESGQLEMHHELLAKDRKGIQPLAFSPDGKTVYMSDNTQSDRAVIREYDLLTKKMSEPIFGGNGVEATGVVIGSHVSNFGKVLGYIGDGAKREIQYIDEESAVLQKLLDDALPKDQTHNIVSRSDDMNVIVVRSSGVKMPSQFHLLVNKAQLVPLGRSYPNINEDKLSDMEYVEYKARDGLTIPAYLTKPKFGKPPYPAVIMPHGGPWARDFHGWNLWVQFLANRGYAVLQPQYRGSEGWGQNLWRAGDREWGQQMQDDKDDGAAWLVQQGITSKDRIAIYGYSYGGYAAMAAIVRPNSPYQCAIAGAGLAELRTFDKITFQNAFNREFQNPTIGGLSPLDHAKDASIPIYIFHGDRDQRVPVEQSRKYYKALKKAGKDVEYNEIPDLWHSLPWWPTHHINVLSNLEDYLANRCGPGGL